jgi:hypothetical protein
MTTASGNLTGCGSCDAGTGLATCGRGCRPTGGIGQLAGWKVHLSSHSCPTPQAGRAVSRVAEATSAASLPLTTPGRPRTEHRSWPGSALCMSGSSYRVGLCIRSARAAGPSIVEPGGRSIVPLSLFADSVERTREPYPQSTRDRLGRARTGTDSGRLRMAER